MFIREVKKKNGPNGKPFSQFSLVQNSRINGVVKQRSIIYLGSDQALGDKNNRNLVCLYLKSKIFNQDDLFPIDMPDELLHLAQSYYAKYIDSYGDNPVSDAISIPPAPQKADYQTVDLNQLEHFDVKSFGAEHLCTQVIDKFMLSECLSSLQWDEHSIALAKIAICARAIFACSEYKTSQYLNDNSELTQLILGTQQPISHKTLYRVADKLYAHKKQIDQYLYNRVKSLFDIEDKIMIFDISNSYFETSKAGSTLAQYGRSKEKRQDCKLVVFTGVVNAEGFIKHSRIYEGNKPDADTLVDMLVDLEGHCDNGSRKTIVMDAGIATEDNIKLIRSKNYNYVCVARSKLKDYQLDKDNISKVRLKSVDEQKPEAEQYVEVSIVDQGTHDDTWMYVKSSGKEKKEKSIDAKLSARFIQELESLNKGLNEKGKLKNLLKVHEKIGRIKQAYQRVSSKYNIEVKSQGDTAIQITWKRISSSIQEDKAQGIYFIRTNIDHTKESDLWDIYNCIREVESTFRCLKSELNIRPVHHQKDHRIESHIYLTTLAYQLVNTIRYMLKQKGIMFSWSNILRLMQTQVILTTEIVTDTKKMHIRKPSKPSNKVAEIYNTCSCNPTIKSKKTYVVYH